MKKLLVALLALVSLAVVAAGCGGGDKKKEAANSNEIVVGASFELTGNVANYGKSTLSGLKMAFDEVNKVCDAYLKAAENANKNQLKKYIESFYKYMRITNWKYKGNRNIIISNDNIVSGRDQPHSLLLKPFS